MRSIIRRKKLVIESDPETSITELAGMGCKVIPVTVFEDLRGKDASKSTR